MRIQPRERLILVAVGIVLLAVIAGLLLIMPQLKTIATISAQISEAEKQVDEANALLQQRQEMKDRAAQTDAAYLRLANAVPETPELPSLIIELQDVALQAGVDFQSLRPEDPIGSSKAAASNGQPVQASTGAEDYYVIPIQVTVSGTWSDTIDFMNRLQHMTRGIRVVEYSAAANTGTTNQDEQSKPTAQSEITNLKLEAYTMPVAASATGANPAPVPASQ